MRGLYDYHFYIFILLFLFGILIIAFNSFIERPYYIDVLSWLLMVVPAIAFVYLLKFPDANVTAYYVLFSALLIGYVVIFAGWRIAEIMARAG